MAMPRWAIAPPSNPVQPHQSGGPRPDERVSRAEIQQTSDITYRIFDYNRVDKATGKTRDLHNDLALDIIDFEAQL